MPSEATTQRAGGLWLVLRSQGLGLLCGQATVLLLAVGSVIIAATRESASAAVQMDDVRVFFEQRSPWHLWFYLLVPVLGLFALNTVLCTWHSTARKWAAGQRSPWHHGPAVIHVGFLLALVAHLIGGLGSREEQPLVLGTSWQSLGGGQQVRLVDLSVQTLPSGMPKQVHARVQWREGKIIHSDVIGYNQPLSWGGGSHLLLLANFGWAPTAQLTDGSRRCSAGARTVCTLGPQQLHVLAIHPSGHWGPTPAVLLRALDASGAHEQFFLLPGRAYRLQGGATVRLERVDHSPEVVLRSRTAPGNPWALAASVLLMLGMVLMGRRWL